MKRPKKARKQASEESLEVTFDERGGFWRAKYGWGTGTSFHNPILAAARALRRRLERAKPFVPNINIPHYGEWYGGYQGRSDPVSEHRELLLESA